MKTTKWVGGVVVAILTLSVLYLLFQIRGIVNPSYRTETAIYYEMSENIEMTAAAVFEYQTVDGGGLLGYLVEDGERVSPGQTVVENYASAEQQQAQLQYRQLQNQIELLQAAGNVEGSDVGAISKKMESGLYLLLADLDEKAYSHADDDFNEYLLAANKIQCLTGRVSSFADQIAQLQIQMEVLASAIGTPTAIASPASGYFVRSSLVASQPYTAEQLDAMSASEMQTALQSVTAQQSAGIGRIVTDYHWEIYGTTTSELAQQLKAKQKMTMRLPERGGIEFPVTVESVQTDRESGLCKIKLYCENITPEALGLGVEQVELVVNEYEGIRVPRQAEHIRTVTNEDGETVEEYGVYVQLGRLMYFQKITNKLYENDEYMLLPLEPENTSLDQVRLYDEVIVSGIDLQDGKLI